MLMKFIFEKTFMTTYLFQKSVFVCGWMNIYIDIAFIKSKQWFVMLQQVIIIAIVKQRKKIVATLNIQFLYFKTKWYFKEIIKYINF